MAMAQMNRVLVTATDYPAEQLLSETDTQEQLVEDNDSQEELLGATDSPEELLDAKDSPEELLDATDPSEEFLDEADPPEELLDKIYPTEELLDATDPLEELLDKADITGKPQSLERLQEVCSVLQDANCEEGLSRQMLWGAFDVVDSKYAAGAFDIQAVPKGVWMFRLCLRGCGCSGCA